MLTRSSADAERNLTEEQATEQRQELRNNYDFYVVLDCLEVFEEEIDLSEELTLQRLEDEIVSSTGTEANLLSHVHQVWPRPGRCCRMRCVGCHCFLWPIPLVRQSSLTCDISSAS